MFRCYLQIGMVGVLGALVAVVGCKKPVAPPAPHNNSVAVGSGSADKIPEPKHGKCPTSYILNEGECFKECRSASDCAHGEICQDLHEITEDDRIGAYVGGGCMGE
jgi:hypothetical protein